MKNADTSPALRLLALNPAVGKTAGNVETDSQLFEMVAALVEANDRRRAHDLETSVGMIERYNPPEIPAALAFRPSDFPNVCAEPLQECAESKVAGVWRAFYDNPEALTAAAQAYWATGKVRPHPHFTSMNRARVRAIKAAYEHWQADIRHAENVAGITESAQAADRECETITDLLRKIAATPTRTLAGIAAKGQAAAIARGSTLCGLEHQLAADLSKPDLSVSGQRDLLSISFAIDTLRLSETPKP